jgi:zinc transport system substrate-binding protein
MRALSPTSPAATDAADQATDEAISVVTSFYPLYFLASEIGGKHVAAFNLIPAGVEPHDWTPKSRDITTASKAQLFLYHGAGLEGWVDGFLSGLDKNSGVITKEMSEGITLIAGSGEEHAEEEGHDHDHEHEDEAANHEHEEEGHDHGDMDPHTWVSPKSALKLAENVKNSLVEIDAANQADYEQNYEQLKQKLETIDQAYTEQLAQVPNKNIVVSHQAFGYLARDYGLKQVAIMGLSPDAEPRAQDLLKIAKFVKENNVKYIFFEELVSDQLANTLAGEADVDTMVLNPLEGLTPDQEKAGDTYLTLMERNLQNLVQALQ